MAMQGYGSAPGRNTGNAVGTSAPRSQTTKPIPLVLSAMKPADAKALALKNLRGK